MLLACILRENLINNYINSRCYYEILPCLKVLVNCEISSIWSRRFVPVCLQHLQEKISGGLPLNVKCTSALNIPEDDGTKRLNHLDDFTLD
jgi:hypothetical protein